MVWGLLGREVLIFSDLFLQFPNAVVLNVIVCRNTQLSAKERKCAQKGAKERKRKSAKERKGAQKGAQERKRALPGQNCKQPGLKQPGLGTPNCLGDDVVAWNPL